MGHRSSDALREQSDCVTLGTWHERQLPGSGCARIRCCMLKDDMSDDMSVLKEEMYRKGIHRDLTMSKTKDIPVRPKPSIKKTVRRGTLEVEAGSGARTSGETDTTVQKLEAETCCRQTSRYLILKSEWSQQDHQRRLQKESLYSRRSCTRRMMIHEYFKSARQTNPSWTSMRL